MTIAQGSRADVSRNVSELLRQNPRPAVLWVVVALGLLVLELGAVLEFGGSVLVDATRAINAVDAVPVRIGTEPLVSFEQAATEIPRLLSRQTIPNAGYYSGAAEEWVVGPVYYDGTQWVGTFLGLEPAHAWAVRVVVVYAYALAVVAWVWFGYRVYRRHYRVADWTPRDDVTDRLRSHYWGLFGLVVVLLLLTTVLFGPALAPTTNQVDNIDPYSYEIQYWDAETERVAMTTVGTANGQSGSTGSENVGPMSYDDFGRFHPFGTLPGGQDLFTFLMYGARLSLVIGLISVGLSTAIAASLAMVSAYYKGRVDLGLVLLSDSIMALPALLVIIMLSVLLGGTWLSNVYDGGLLLAVVFVVTGWPGLWRAIRGPTFQTTEREWVDAARGFGHRPTTIMRKHVLPYVAGYLLVYGSMNLGGIIIGIAGLSYLGLGVNPPTPEWGRAIGAGQPYIGTPSWHISIIPGILVTIIVIGFNALGDGIRDAIDPQSDADAADTGGVERGGGA
jgi:peptide/nickel transport system permease protein